MKLYHQNSEASPGKKSLVLVLLGIIFLLCPFNHVSCQQTNSMQNDATATVGPSPAIARSKEELRIAKSYAKLSFKKYLKKKVIEKTREMAIEIKIWTIDHEKERYSIDYEVIFEVLKDDYYGDEWITLKRSFILQCDIDGRNAHLKSTEEKLNFIFENIKN
jgi:hypothetical protein